MVSLRRLLLVAASAALGACGGDGVNTITYRPPPPPPTPVPAIIHGATASQEFSVKGAAIKEVAFPDYKDPVTAQSEQLRIRYNSTTNTYEVLQPDATGWQPLSPSGSQWTTYPSPGENVTLTATGSDLGYSYSSLAGWYKMDGSGLTYAQGGVIAFGVATQSSAIPVSGTATYDGLIAGVTTETFDWADWGRGPGGVSGTIKLTFDFEAGSLAGSIDPHIWAGSEYDLPTLNFVNTVFSKGSTTFSGKFDTTLSGANAFSGLFTGPQASELIGNFSFPYKSELDHKNYEAGGGFIAKH